MQKYVKCEVLDNKYLEIKNMQLSNGTAIREHHLGSRKKLIVYNKLIATTSATSSLELGGITKQQFHSFLGAFTKILYKQFLLKPDLFDLEIYFKGISRAKNKKQWDMLPAGAFFYNIDLNSAYWQICYMLDYIPEKFFLDYLNNDNFKQAKRYCVSFLGRENKMFYLQKDNIYEIKCNTDFQKKIYSNIRNMLYLCINEALIGVDDWVEFNIDGVSVVAESLNLVKQRFKEQGLKYKITECRKINDIEYSYGNKIKQYKLK